MLSVFSIQIMYTKLYYDMPEAHGDKRGSETPMAGRRKKRAPHLSRESHGTDGAPHTVWTQITIFIFESQLLRAIALPQLTTTFAIRATALLAHAV